MNFILWIWRAWTQKPAQGHLGGCQVSGSESPKLSYPRATKKALPPRSSDINVTVRISSLVWFWFELFGMKLLWCHGCIVFLWISWVFLWIYLTWGSGGGSFPHPDLYLVHQKFGWPENLGVVWVPTAVVFLILSLLVLSLPIWAWSLTSSSHNPRNLEVMSEIL